MLWRGYVCVAEVLPGDVRTAKERNEGRESMGLEIMDVGERTKVEEITRRGYIGSSLVVTHVEDYFILCP